MRAFYNDTERFACDWIQQLMDAGEIMPGVIDDRSIADISPDDLAGFDRVHLFAGIGGWELALRIAGWGSDPVWTCSCPCPPFSQAGKRQRCPRCEGTDLVWCPRRTGHCICADCSHAWSADARHLWPEAWRLIARCRPPVVFGEQVASADGLGWLAGVRASLEIISYAPWGVDYPAAGVGAPNIRQRLWWVADGDAARRSVLAQRDGREIGGREVQFRHDADRRGGHGADRLALAHEGQRRRLADRKGRQRDGAATGWQQGDRVLESGSEPCWLANADGGLARNRDLQPGWQHGQQQEDGGAGGLGLAAERRRGPGSAGQALPGGPTRGPLERSGGSVGGVADGALDGRREEREITRGGRAGDGPQGLTTGSLSGRNSDWLGDADFPGSQERRRGPQQQLDPQGWESSERFAGGLDRPWSRYDIVHCTDGKARRIPQSALQRLADGLSDGVVRGSFEGAEGFPLTEKAGNRVGRLRGFGNAINPYAAAEVIRTWREVRAAA